MQTGKPISPSELEEFRMKLIPSYMFDVVNQLITERLIQGTAIVSQADILKRFCGTDERRRKETLERGWLNFEDAYRAVGWKVEYDKPMLNEVGEAVFVFTKPGNR